MSAIPADIMAAASSAMEKLNHRPHNYDIGKSIEGAILAERRRLARQVYDATFDDDILKIRRMMHDILA